MKSNAAILKEILERSKAMLSEGSDFGYTMPDGKYHIYIYPDQEVDWDGSVDAKFFVVEPNRVVHGAHEPMGDTFLTETQDLSEVLIGCQWCLDTFEADKQKDHEHTSTFELPDELTVRLAHEAGWLEAGGKIKVNSWEEFQTAIRDAIRQYYESPNERNPFTIEETIEKILFERFPAEQKNSPTPTNLSLDQQIKDADSKRKAHEKDGSGRPQNEFLL